MKKSNYSIRYLPTFSKDLNSISHYMINTLENKNIAENFYLEVKKEIEKRSFSPEAFEVYRHTKDGKYKWYRIYLKNFTIFYVVANGTMEVRRILYNKRNFKKLI